MIKHNLTISALKLFSILSIIVLISCKSNNNNWPQFRGPEGNQVVHNQQPPEIWGPNQNVAWEFELDGRGWSCPIVWGNKVFFTNAVLEDPSVLPPAKEGRRQENPVDAVYNFEVICLDTDTGKELWKRVAYHGKPNHKTHRDNNYAPETMVTDGERVYAYFGMTGLYCYDMNGNLMWEKNLGIYPMQSDWGTSTSPMLHEGVLYLQIDNEESSFLAALDADTGEEIWRIDRDEKSNWGTPVIWKNSVRTELVAPGKKTRGYNPGNGELLWELDMGGGRNITAPVPYGDILVAGNEERRSGGGILFAVKAGATGNISLKEDELSNKWVKWSVPESGIAMATPVIYEDLIYIVERRRGQIFCYDVNTGETVYSATNITDAEPFWASPWAYNGNIYCLDEEGTTHVIKAGREFSEVRTNKLNDTFWATPTVANNSWFFRGEKGMYCIK